MAVYKSTVEVVDPAGHSLGEGIAYVHLPRGQEVAQPATGTVSLRRWSPGAELPTHLALADGRRLGITVSLEKLSDCSRNHVLRFEAAWPPTEG